MAGHDLIVPQGGITTSDQRDDLDAAVDAFAASAKSAATRRAYRADARDFIAWCEGQGAEPVPAEPRTVSRYVTTSPGCGRSTRRSTAGSPPSRRCTAVAATTRRPHAKRSASVLAGIRNTMGRPPRKKKALTDDLVVKVLRKIGTTSSGLRDRAMLALCFGAALRRSELVGLDVGDIEFHSRGLVVTVRRSKTDQSGKGKRKGVPDGKLKVPDALQAWLDASRHQGWPAVPRLRPRQDPRHAVRRRIVRPRGEAPLRGGRARSDAVQRPFVPLGLRDIGRRARRRPARHVTADGPRQARYDRVATCRRRTCSGRTPGRASCDAEAPSHCVSRDTRFSTIAQQPGMSSPASPSCRLESSCCGRRNLDQQRTQVQRSRRTRLRRIV